MKTFIGVHKKVGPLKISKYRGWGNYLPIFAQKMVHKIIVTGPVRSDQFCDIMLVCYLCLYKGSKKPETYISLSICQDD